MPNILRSLILTVLLAFALPLVGVGSILGLLLGISYLPGIAALGQVGIDSILHVLSVFGSGYPLLGMLTIGGTCGLVGGVFDVFNFYFFQGVKEH